MSPEQKEKNRARAREWYKKNKERAKKRIKEWAQKNPELRNLYNRRWRQKNKEKVAVLARRSHETYYPKARALYIERARQRLRKIRKDQRCSCCTNKDIQALYNRALEINGEVDHIVPLSMNGLHCVKNLQVLSREAHKQKTNLDIRKIKDFKLTQVNVTI